MLAEIKIRPNNILNKEGVISAETKAPITLPGIESKPSFNPIEYSILFCLAYDAEDAIALLKVAKRLLLAAKVGA